MAFGQNEMAMQKELCVFSPETHLNLFQWTMEQKGQEMWMFQRKDQNSVILGISRNSSNSLLRNSCRLELQACLGKKYQVYQ